MEASRILEGRAEAEAMEELYLPPSLHGLLSLLLYTTQDHQTKTGSAYSDLGPPTSIIN